MTDQELQQAIDSTRSFLATPSDGMSSMLDSKKNSVEYLKKLEQIQLQRAGAIHSPGVQPGAIIQLSDDPCPGCRPGGVCRTPSCGRLKARSA